MARLMSFFHTMPQILDRTKTVTRRRGWKILRAGDELWAVEKAQGLPKGGKVKRIAYLEVVSVRREPLNLITSADVAREGFPEWGRDEFVRFFVDGMGGSLTQRVTRIEFRYLPMPERPES